MSQLLCIGESLCSSSRVGLFESMEHREMRWAKTSPLIQWAYFGAPYYTKQEDSGLDLLVHVPGYIQTASYGNAGPLGSFQYITYHVGLRKEIILSYSAPPHTGLNDPVVTMASTTDWGCKVSPRSQEANTVNGHCDHLCPATKCRQTSSLPFGGDYSQMTVPTKTGFVFFPGRLAALAFGSTATLLRIGVDRPVRRMTLSRVSSAMPVTLFASSMCCLASPELTSLLSVCEMESKSAPELSANRVPSFSRQSPRSLGTPLLCFLVAMPLTTAVSRYYSHASLLCETQNIEPSFRNYWAINRLGSVRQPRLARSLH